MSTLTVIIVAVIAFIIIFLLLRELNCWYWKINERISLMEEQNNLLRKLFLGSASNGEVVLENLTNGTPENSVKTYKKNTVTFRHKVTNNIETVDIEYWEKMKKTYGENNYEVIEYHN